MKRRIPKLFRGAVSDKVTTTKKFCYETEICFMKRDNVETSTTFVNLVSLKSKSKENIWKYIMEMYHITLKANALKFELSNDLFVHLVLIFLRAQLNQFKVIIIFKRRSELLMSSLHIVCKKKNG